MNRWPTACARVRGTLYAVPFDATSLRLTGDPFPVVQGIATAGTGAANYGFSDTGTLAYMPAELARPERAVVWVTRDGHEERLPLPERPYFALRLSPDGRRVALDIRDQDTDIWVPGSGSFPRPLS